MFKDIGEFDQKRKALEMGKAMLKFALKKQGPDGIPPMTPFTPGAGEASPMKFNRPMQQAHLQGGDVSPILP
jgi:hypothetical protein